MRPIARGCANPAARASPISTSPRSTNSSSRKSAPSCERLSHSQLMCWPHARCAAMFRASRSNAGNRRTTMPVSTADKRATFRKLHESGCFIIPNPFDVGSAKALQHLGFKALASTSAGFAWTIGKADNRITLDDALKHLTELCAAVDLPVNADFEGGFAHEPDKVGANVARGVKTGVAGLSIEDSTGDKNNPLYDRDVAVARIKAARAAIDADNSGVLLTGRCEAFLVGRPDIDLVIDRLKAYSDAGADCLYAPGQDERTAHGGG